MVNLKLKSRNLKHRKRKNKRPKWSKSTEISKTHKSLRAGRRPGCVCSCEAGCLFEITIFEVDASLKRMFQQSKLESGTCFTKKEKKKYC